MDFKKVIKEICDKDNIKYELFSKGWGIALTKNNVTKCILGHQFPLNNQSVSTIIDDKYAFYDLCKLLKYPIIEHQILFNFKSQLGKNTLDLIYKYFKEYNGDVVIKPNKGLEGNGVFHIKDIDELINRVTKLFQNNFSISICPFYSIDSEYRVIVLDGEVKLIYEKMKPVVVGNGVNTIRELLINLNPFYFERMLKEEKYNDVLDRGKKFEYDWRFNLSNGATAKLVENVKLEEELSKLALNITNKINARFVSVDIIKSNNNFYLIELNSTVCINKACNFIGEDIAKEIYSEAVNKMFD